MNTLDKLEKLSKENTLAAVDLAFAMKEKGHSNGEILKTICKVFGGHETIAVGDDEGNNDYLCVYCNQKV